MEWTNIRPTTPGYYWLRRPSESPQPVNLDERGGWWVTGYDVEILEKHLPAEYSDGWLFYGPIEPPPISAQV